MRTTEIGRFVWKFTSIQGVSTRRTSVSRRMVKDEFFSTLLWCSAGPHTSKTRQESDLAGPGLSTTMYQARV